MKHMKNQSKVRRYINLEMGLSALGGEFKKPSDFVVIHTVQLIFPLSFLGYVVVLCLYGFKSNVQALSILLGRYYSEKRNIFKIKVTVSFHCLLTIVILIVFKGIVKKREIN